MTRAQRRKYEMFVRVRNFGTVNRDAFPESAVSGQTFGQVAEAVAALEEHLTRRTQARAEASKVKATTRAAVTRYMRAIAATGRQAAAGEWGTHPFRMPTRKSAPVVLTTARLFMEEAARRKDKFVGLGMPPTFLADFQKLVDDLAQAINLRQDSKGYRRKAQVGLESTLASGFAAIRNLDVTVANRLREDPARLAQWDGARRIEGQGASTVTAKAVVPTMALPEVAPPLVALQPAMEKAS